MQFVPSFRRHGPGVDEAANEEHVPDTILVLDFNPAHVAIARHSSSGGFRLVGKELFVTHREHCKGVQVIVSAGEPKDNPSLAHDVFEEDVVGRLPYLVYMSDQKWNYDAVLIDEERILGIRVSCFVI